MRHSRRHKVDEGGPAFNATKKSRSIKPILHIIQIISAMTGQKVEYDKNARDELLGLGIERLVPTTER